MIRINGKFILVLLISLGFALIEGGNFPFIIFYGLLSVFLSGFIYMCILRYSLSAEVSFKERIKNAGDSVSYLTVIKNKSKLPIPYIALENEVCDDSCSGSYRVIHNMGYGKDVRIENDIKFFQRGVYNLGSLNIKIMDVFRLLQCQKKVDCCEYIKIYPKIYDIESFSIGGKYIDTRSIDPAGRSEDIFSVKDIRKYREGDSIRRINWKVSAKHDELYVKNPETISGGELAIFLNMRMENIKLGSHGIPEENMIDLCMSMTHRMISEGIKNRIFINLTSPIKFDIDSREGFNSLMEFMTLQKSDGNTDFGQFVHDNFRGLQKQNPIIVISVGIDDELASSVIHVKNSGYGINVLYCVDGRETVKNVSLLNKSGVGCFSFYDVVVQRASTGGEIVDRDAAESI